MKEISVKTNTLKSNIKGIQTQSTLRREVRQMLSEQNLDYSHRGVVEKFTSVVEKMVLKTLKEASYYGEAGKDIDKNDVLLAKALEGDNHRNVSPLDTESLLNLTFDYNTKPLVVKESPGIRIPKENLTNCNYQLESPSKKMRFEAANKLENYRSNQLGNCFRFFIPPKHYKQNNTGGFVIKNTQTMEKMPMKITIRPTFNVQKNVSMLKSNNR